jgi:hypothetical protein
MGQQIDLLMRGDQAEDRRAGDDADNNVGNDDRLAQAYRNGPGNRGDDQKQ